MLLTLCSSKSFSQYYPGPLPVSPIQEDHLLNELKRSVPDEHRIRALLQLGSLYDNKPIKNNKDLDTGILYAAAAKDLSESLHDTANYNEAQLLLGQIYMDQGKADTAEQILRLVNDTTQINLLLALSFKWQNRTTGSNADNFGNSLRLARQAQALIARLHQRENGLLVQKYIATIHGNQGQYALAETELEDLVKQYKAIGYRKLQYVYQELGYLNYNMGNPDKALEYTLEAIRYIGPSGDSTAAGDLYYDLGVVFGQTGQPEKSAEAFTTAFNFFKSHPGQNNLFDAIKALANDRIHQHQYAQALAFLQENYQAYPPQEDADRLTLIGSIGDCYLKLKQYDLAEKYFLQEFNIHKASNSLNEIAYHRIGFFYVESKQYAKAAPYLALALMNQDGNANMGARAHLQYMMFLTDSAAGNYLSAIRHLSQNKLYDDSLHQQSKLIALGKTTAVYETDKKNQQITLLKQQEELQASNLRRVELVRNITIGGILILLVMGGLLYRAYHQKQLSSLVITQKNGQLEHLLSEKEWLLKEVHHRVKNNLHTVICLLEIQSEFLRGDALLAIENSQHRIYAMSLIHQKLYLSDEVKTINMAEYLPELIDYLKDSFDNPRNICYEINTEPVLLDVSQAMPLALIVNEAVTNSIKYAFPAKKEGRITISIHRIRDQITLRISDNGIGYSTEAAPGQLSSLGLRLIKGLSEDLNAQIEFEHDEGTNITIVFTPALLNDTTT